MRTLDFFVRPFCLLSILGALLTPLPPNASETDEAQALIRVESEEWKDATNADGTGLYWDILRALYEPEGYQLSLITSSYMRSAGLVESQQIDIMVGAYANELKGVIYPHMNFDVDRIYALANASRKDLPDTSQWLGEASLSGRHIGYIKGYQLLEYISAKFQTSVFRDRQVILKSLANNRIDYYLDAFDDLHHAIQSSPYDEILFNFFPVKTLPLYFTFANTPMGQKLAEIHDKRLPLLVQNGWLKQMFSKWHYVYPF